MHVAPLPGRPRSVDGASRSVADHTVNKPLFDQPIHGAMLDLSARLESKGVK